MLRHTHAVVATVLVVGTVISSKSIGVDEVVDIVVATIVVMPQYQNLVGQVVARFWCHGHNQLCMMDYCEGVCSVEFFQGVVEI